MSDEPGDARPATDPQRPATDPWGNPLPPGTEQQPPRSAIPPYVPPAPPQPAPAPPPPTQGPAPGMPPGETGAPDQPPESWWPADPNQQPPPAGTDAWGQPIGGPVGQTTYGQPPHAGQPGHPGQPGYGAPTNAGTAVGALVCGILSLICGFLGGCGIVFGPIAIVLGLNARKKIRRSNGMVTGEGLATAGIVLGIVGALLSVIVLAIAFSDPDTMDRIRDTIDKATSTTTQG
jgi:hypothetical protein